jgi:hypothetical protein
VPESSGYKTEMGKLLQEAITRRSCLAEGLDSNQIQEEWEKCKKKYPHAI